MGNVPEGFSPIRVETGINDDNFIEIVSGLKEGVTVYVKSMPTSSGFNMFGMMGGGMPAGGGMPSGGGMPGAAGQNYNRQRN